MRARAERRRPAAGVGRGHGHLKARVGAEPVLRAQLKAERVPGPAEQVQTELDVIGGLRDQLPARPSGQAVNGVVVGRLGEIELVGQAAEGVAAVVDPVRPRRQELARARGRDVVRAIGPDERLAGQAERPQAGA